MRKLFVSMVLAALPAMHGCAIDAGSGSGKASVEETYGCTFTQGYWKTHEEAWPVDSVSLGNRTYTKAEALAIFATPVQGNGLLALAHQLLAAKLNVANGADDAAIADAIDAADAMIGDLVVPPSGAGSLSPGATSSLVGELDDYNNGVAGPGHCDEPPPPPPPPPDPYCGDGTVDEGEECDPGDDASGAECTADCTLPPPPPPPEPYCGDGTADDGEECDDGNTDDGDGCSHDCKSEEPPPPPPEPYCGDGEVNGEETCDDGNTTDGDGCSATCCEEPPPPPPPPADCPTE